ncbi:rho GTPase-activating protein 23 isoform X2 [Microcaecilia unicolor]|uniref:Rho GTPase-activating protein 23 isoform X2 n=1 Tax=Microcaecilia unicolor TaxID=1415580 RepID=A0A6P7ZFM3_9AMPH|nr:rho GTPase-activating protein 23 isoform X2 [Microcaecilia unicolor]
MSVVESAWQSPYFQWEQAIGVDCSSPEPRCIWLASLRQEITGTKSQQQSSSTTDCMKQQCRPHLGTEQQFLQMDGDFPPGPLVPWVGPKTLHIRKNPQGFGFTLRHFIVYPPESAVQAGAKEEEKDNRNQTAVQSPCSHLEPMDTIFVKNVKEGGPAHLAGLCTGDRLVKVNGESIVGKTYSQVIALIQNSEDALELSIMPKDEDILQLAYSQDAYLKGNDPYTGGAQSIPEPPPVCYSQKTCTYRGWNQAQEPRVLEPLVNKRAESRPHWIGNSLPMTADSVTSPIPSARSRPRIDAIRSVESNIPSPVCLMEEIQYGMTQPKTGIPVGRSTFLASPSFHFPKSSCQGSVNHSLSSMTNYSNSKLLPAHQTRAVFKDFRDLGQVPATKGNPNWECLRNPNAITRFECQQALSNWMSNQVPRRNTSEEQRHAMPLQYRSISQDRLGYVPVNKAWPHSASQDTLHQSNHEHSSLRSRSDIYLANYENSTDSLEQNAVASPRFDRCLWKMDKFYRPGPFAGPQVGRLQQSQASSYSSPLTSRDFAVQVRKHPSQPNLQSTEDSGYVGYQSYSPSFQRRTELLHALSYRDTTFGDLPTFNMSQRKETQPAPCLDKLSSSHIDGTSCSESSLSGTSEITRDQRLTILDKSPEQSSHEDMGHQQPEVEEKKEEVVLRQKPPTGRKAPPALRQMNFAFPVDVKDVSNISIKTSSSKDKHGDSSSQRVAPLATTEDSLASIPFIDEPTSPNIDLKAKHVPASSVVCSAMKSAPIKTTSPALPNFNFAINRHYSQDCSSIKASRRSSYLVAITTERSKSCDEGLNSFREEGKFLRKLPNRVPSLRMLRSFFTDGSLDSLGTSEDSRSKKHLPSDLLDVKFSDVRKEGWLHYKQILTKKGKKVGGGIRQWKRVFSVLRSHLLYLYKDRREADSYAPSQGEEEQPISIQACLVDISYSETKRKHVLRLTTADFCEYLFQAEDRDDMLSWIKAIREDSKIEGEPGFASQALINKKLNDYRKVSLSGTKPDSSPKGPRVPEFLRSTGMNAPQSPKQDSSMKDEGGPTKGSWGRSIMKKTKKFSPRAFGVRLEDCQPGVDNKKVPLIVESCCKLVEEKGLHYMGIYRVPGNNAVVSSLQEQLNKGVTEINLQDERWQDLNVISSLLKSFFRKLPEPLFTDDKYSDFIEANRVENATDRIKTLWKLIKDLPAHNYETLKFLIRHLKIIADHCDKNKMEPRNLALVFGPTLVRTSEDNMTDMVTHMPDRYKIVETLIQHSDWFFSEEEKGEKTPVEERDTQSVPNIEHLLPNIGRTVAPAEASDSTRSNSAKSKTKEMLSIPFMAIVNRKKMKWQEEKCVPSNRDDSEHETANKHHVRVEETQEQQGHGAMEEQLDNVKSLNHRNQGMKDKDNMNREPDIQNQQHFAALAAEVQTVAQVQMNFKTKKMSSVRLGRSVEEMEVTAETQSTDCSSQEMPGERLWQSSDMSQDRITADSHSIVSGYSTMSTIDRSICSEVQSVAESRGDEADDERSEFSHLESDTQSSFASCFLPEKSVLGVLQNKCREDSSPGLYAERCSDSKVHGQRRSFSSHQLIKCDTLARLKVSRQKTESCVPTSVDTAPSDHKPDELQVSESLKHPVPMQHKPHMKSSADDMFGVGLRKPNSPETRRKKKVWRRHTVVVQSKLTDFNFNEWKEHPGGTGEPKAVQLSSGLLSCSIMHVGDACSLESCTRTTESLEDPNSYRDLHSDCKDSGLSSLESFKARPLPSTLNSSASTPRLDKDQDSTGNPIVTSQAPKCAASLRFHQYL